MRLGQGEGVTPTLGSPCPARRRASLGVKSRFSLTHPPLSYSFVGPALSGVFCSNSRFQETRGCICWFTDRFPFKRLSPSATVADSLSFPTALAVSTSTTTPINLSAQESTLGNFKYRSALLPISATTAVTDGACSSLGMAQRNYSSQESSRQRRVSLLALCATLNPSLDSNSRRALR